MGVVQIRETGEIGCRQTETASKPVKLQRPDKGRRVQSLLSRICSPAPFVAKNKPRRVLGNRQKYVGGCQKLHRGFGIVGVRITLRWVPGFTVSRNSFRYHSIQLQANGGFKVFRAHDSPNAIPIACTTGTVTHEEGFDGPRQYCRGNASNKSTPIHNRSRLHIRQEQVEIRAANERDVSRKDSLIGRSGSGGDRHFLGFASPRRNNHLENRSRVGVRQP